MYIVKIPKQVMTNHEFIRIFVVKVLFYIFFNHFTKNMNTTLHISNERCENSWKFNLNYINK